MRWSRHLTIAALAVAGVCIGAGFLPASPPQRAAWKAGAARVDITPAQPMPMAGYYSRGNRPFDKIVQPLNGKILVLRWGEGPPVVFITLDLVGVPRSFTDRLTADLRKRFGIPPERVCVATSHTHTGPAVHEQFRVLLGFTSEQWAAIERYLDHVHRQLVGAVGQALANARPAWLEYAVGTCRFAMNRRARRGGRIVLGVNPNGPVDHSVPGLWVLGAADRRPMAVLFGYACHCTTLGGDFFGICGDYAGYAQEQLEARFPGITACFVAGCGGDANPYPRGKLALARQHGQSLARAVESTLSGRRLPVRGPVAAVRRTVQLEFARVPDVADYARLAEKEPNSRRGKHARWMVELARRNGGQLPGTYPYLIQAFQFGDDLTFVGLAGEVVAEYGLNLKRRFAGNGQPPVWVAAYVNDVFAYIPTRQMLQEGGYEPVGSMISWGWHSVWADTVEEAVMKGAAQVIEELRGADGP